LCVGNAKSLLMMLECGSLKVCAFKSSELLHHNIWEVLARNFPGQFAIINKKIKKKERKKCRHHFQDFEGKRWHIFHLKDAAVLDSHIIMCTEKD